MTVALLVLAGLVAVGDWIAVARGQHRLEIALKPLTLVLLIAAAASADLGDAKPWVVAALAFGLMGDVALLFSEDTPAGGDLDPFFLAGLGSFLIGHVAYVVAFAQHGVHAWQALAGLLVVAGASSLALPRVLRGAHEQGGKLLAAIVALYAALLAAMTTMSFGTAAVATAIGGALFLASDITLAWNRFVQPLLRGPVLVIVTYHLAQLLIVVGLLR